MKLLADSFGPDVLEHTAIIFTHSDGRVTPEKAKERVAQIAAVMRGLVGKPADTFRVFQLDTRVDSRPGSTPEYIQERKAENIRNFDALLSWLRSQKPLPTVDFKVGEYAEMKRLREEREALVRAEAERKAAQEALAAAELARVTAAAKHEAEAAQRKILAEEEEQRVRILVIFCCVCTVIVFVFRRTLLRYFGTLCHKNSGRRSSGTPVPRQHFDDSQA
jgi:hypothetical protein